MKNKPPRALGILLAVLGIAFGIGGLEVLRMGGVRGGLYFLFIGIGIMASGIFIAFGKKAGLYTYALTLAVMIVWSVVDAGTNMQQLLPRIALPILIGVYMFSGKVRGRLE